MRTNRLAGESSPYLLQHARNPVDWYPWGPEAFDKAKREDKPVFLSIGYSTCHWCHVMERESFEDEGIAEILNRHFISVKVDREERPDVDRLIMAFVVAATGHGGWPLSAWLTPDLKPFTGGTYFPREDRFGLPGFGTVLLRIAELWGTNRDEIESSAQAVAEHLRRAAGAEKAGEVRPEPVLRRGFELYSRAFDPRFGGFSAAPKFPPATAIQFLLRWHRRSGSPDALLMAEKTLAEMARGGLYDQLGGGFHRYSTDERWIVPHFEKMLYDNALLATAFIEAWQVTRNGFYARIARETLDYVLRDMTSEAGGFHSAEDADSEGVEGKFYVWNPGQLLEVLGERDAARFMEAYDVTPAGNWEPHEESLPKGQSVLRLRGEELPDLEEKVLEARSRRVRPGLDDKVIASWNGLMISALARAAQAFGEARYREAAGRAARFLLENHIRDGRLLRVSRGGEAKIDGYLDDYAFFAAALLDLYETTFDPEFLLQARRLTDRAVELFRDGEGGGFFPTSASHGALITRLREEYEGPMPTGSSVMAMNLLRLFGYTGEAAYRERAEETVRSFREDLDRNPAAQAYLLCVLDRLLGPAREVVIAGPEPGPFLEALRSRFLPGVVVALADGPARFPLVEGKTALDGKTAAYVCEDMACREPVTDLEKFIESLDRR